jgi:hypothetical protein
MRQSYLYLTICTVQYLQEAHSRLYTCKAKNKQLKIENTNVWFIV